MRISAVTFQKLSDGTHVCVRIPCMVLSDGFQKLSREHRGSFRDFGKRDYDGIFVMDSFAIIEGPKAWEEYVAEILFQVWKATNMKCLAVVSGGASFGKFSYEQMFATIRRNFAAPRFVVWISMGNDLYPLDIEHIPQSHLYERTTKLLNMASRWAPENRMVFGGSSTVWGYVDKFSPSVCSFYDTKCIMVREYLRTRGEHSCITGALIFQGMVLKDRIGHVSAESMPILIEGFRILTRWGMAQISMGYGTDIWHRYLVIRMLRIGVLTLLLSRL